MRALTVMTLAVGLLWLVAVSPNSGAAEAEAFAFTYFYGESEERGIHLAVSRDGLRWGVVNGDAPVLERPFGSVVRDPAVRKTREGDYAVVWTTAWDGSGGEVTAGFARTRDFIEWRDVRAVPLMKNTPETVNVWAPELFHDEERERWMLYWASSVEDRYPETAHLGSPRANNRLYYATSEDLENFGEEQLLYDEGFITNDSYILKTGGDPRGDYCMVVKKILRPGKGARLYLAFGDSATGPYRITGEAVSGDYAFCEGPTVIRIGGYYYCYFDLSREHRMACVRSKSLRASAWEDVTGQLTLPKGAKHGSIVKISDAVYQKLQALR